MLQGESTVPKVRGEVLRAPVSWKYHEAQIDTMNTYSPLGSKKNVRKMMDLLRGTFHHLSFRATFMSSFSLVFTLRIGCERTSMRLSAGE